MAFVLPGARAGRVDGKVQCNGSRFERVDECTSVSATTPACLQRFDGMGTQPEPQPQRLKEKWMKTAVIVRAVEHGAINVLMYASKYNTTWSGQWVAHSNLAVQMECCNPKPSVLCPQLCFGLRCTRQ